MAQGIQSHENMELKFKQLLPMEKPIVVSYSSIGSVKVIASLFLNELNRIPLRICHSWFSGVCNMFSGIALLGIGTSVI